MKKITGGVVVMIIVLAVLFCIKNDITFKSISELVSPSSKVSKTSDDKVSTPFAVDDVRDFVWTNSVLKAKYASRKWNTIQTKNVDGFSPKASLVEMQTQVPVNKKFNSLKYYFNGSTIATSYYLEDEQGKKIDSKEKLFERFGPVDSEEEAVSFLAVQSFLVYATTSVLMGSTITTDDGYLVQVVFNDSWGCNGSYLPYGIIYQVGKDGVIEKVAEEKKKKSSVPKPCP